MNTKKKNQPSLKMLQTRKEGKAYPSCEERKKSSSKKDRNPSNQGRNKETVLALQGTGNNVKLHEFLMANNEKGRLQYSMTTHHDETQDAEYTPTKVECNKRNQGISKIRVVLRSKSLSRNISYNNKQIHIQTEIDYGYSSCKYDQCVNTFSE